MADQSPQAGETDGELLQRLGDDAGKWAAEFRATALRLGYSDMDEDWLIGWFANAIEHSSDVRRWRLAAAPSAPPLASPRDPAHHPDQRWCQPGDVRDRKWLLTFDDADRGIATFDNEVDAREGFRKASDGGWNCYLFAAAPLLDAAAPPSASAARIAALEKALELAAAAMFQAGLTADTTEAWRVARALLPTKEGE